MLIPNGIIFIFALLGVVWVGQITVYLATLTKQYFEDKPTEPLPETKHPLEIEIEALQERMHFETTYLKGEVSFWKDQTKKYEERLNQAWATIIEKIGV
jgi:hypothetical protein